MSTRKPSTLQGYFQPVQQFGDELLSGRERFRRDVCEFARALRPMCRNENERGRCDNIIRGHSLSHDGLEFLCRLSARRQEAPLGLAKLVEAKILAHCAEESMCRFDASHNEQQANAALDDAQLLAHHEDSPTRWSLVWELATQQAFVSTRLANTAYRFVVRAS